MSNQIIGGIVSDLAKYSMTRSVARSLCDSRAACLSCWGVMIYFGRLTPTTRSKLWGSVWNCSLQQQEAFQLFIRHFRYLCICYMRVYSLHQQLFRQKLSLCELIVSAKFMRWQEVVLLQSLCLNYCIVLRQKGRIKHCTQSVLSSVRLSVCLSLCSSHVALTTEWKVHPELGLRGWSTTSPNKLKMVDGGHIEFRKMLIYPY